MIGARSDLDGLRLKNVSDGDDTWVVFHGLRHKVENPYSFFLDSTFTFCDELATIAVGPSLAEDARLVREKGTQHVYLVFGLPLPVKFMISSEASFREFGFNPDRITDVPAILIGSFMVGREIQGAVDRASKEFS